MPNGLFRAGKNSRVQVETVNLNKSKWDVNLHGDDIDTTNFESGGVDQGLIGILGAEWNLGGLWDLSQSNLVDPPGLYPRDNLGQVSFYPNLADGLTWSFPTNRVLSSKNGAEVRQAVTFESSGKTNGGPFTVPGGTSSSVIGVNAY